MSTEYYFSAPVTEEAFFTKLPATEEKTPMDFNYHFANTIVERLNDLIRNEGVRNDIEALIPKRVDACGETREHSSVTVVITDKKQGTGELGLLGVLNGIVGKEYLVVAVYRNKYLESFRLMTREEFHQQPLHA